jgi:hypothetical protein
MAKKGLKPFEKINSKFYFMYNITLQLLAFRLKKTQRYLP